MIRIIKEEPVSFGSRLDQLMKEQRIHNEDIADLLNCSKTTVSNWRTGKHSLRRFKENYYDLLARCFDVDPEYLKCTQLERKARSGRKRHIQNAKFGAKWLNPVNGKLWSGYDSVQGKIKAMKKFKENSQVTGSEMKLRSEMLDVLHRMGITIDPEIIGSGTNRSEYQILEDGMIKTVIQEEEHPRHSNSYTVTLPDGSECIRSAEEIKEIYQSMKEHLISSFKK